MASLLNPSLLPPSGSLSLFGGGSASPPPSIDAGGAKGEGIPPASLTKYGLPTAEQLIVRSAYVASYDRRARNPHWVLEHVTAASIKGPAERNNKFKEDTSVPAMFRARLTDYAGSGFDRGHLVPAADVKGSQQGTSVWEQNKVLYLKTALRSIYCSCSCFIRFRSCL